MTSEPHRIDQDRVTALKVFIRTLRTVQRKLNSFHEELKARYSLICRGEGCEEPNDTEEHASIDKNPTDDDVVIEEVGSNERKDEGLPMQDAKEPTLQTIEVTTEPNADVPVRAQAEDSRQKASSNESDDSSNGSNQVHNHDDSVASSDKGRASEDTCSDESICAPLIKLQERKTVMVGEHEIVMKQSSRLPPRGPTPPPKSPDLPYSPPVDPPPAPMSPIHPGIPGLPLTAWLYSIPSSACADHQNLNPYWTLRQDEKTPTRLTADHPAFQYLEVDFSDPLTLQRIGLFSSCRIALWWCMRCIIRADMVQKRAKAGMKKLKFAKERWEHWEQQYLEARARLGPESLVCEKKKTIKLKAPLSYQWEVEEKVEPEENHNDDDDYDNSRKDEGERKAEKHEEWNGDRKTEVDNDENDEDEDSDIASEEEKQLVERLAKLTDEEAKEALERFCKQLEDDQRKQPVADLKPFTGTRRFLLDSEEDDNDDTLSSKTSLNPATSSGRKNNQLSDSPISPQQSGAGPKRSIRFKNYSYLKQDTPLLGEQQANAKRRKLQAPFPYPLDQVEESSPDASVPGPFEVGEKATSSKKGARFPHPLDEIDSSAQEAPTPSPCDYVKDGKVGKGDTDSFGTGGKQTSSKEGASFPHPLDKVESSAQEAPTPEPCDYTENMKSLSLKASTSIPPPSPPPPSPLADTHSGDDDVSPEESCALQSLAAETLQQTHLPPKDSDSSDSSDL